MLGFKEIGVPGVKPAARIKYNNDKDRLILIYGLSNTGNSMDEGEDIGI